MSEQDWKVLREWLVIAGLSARQVMDAVVEHQAKLEAQAQLELTLTAAEREAQLPLPLAACP